MRVQLEKEGVAFVVEGKPLARGGEASVFEVPDRPTLLAKVYHKASAEYADKLAVMIAAPPVDPMAAQGHASIAWPTDRLLTADDEKRCVGFVMPRVLNARPLFEFYNPKVRLQVCPLFHYGYLVRTARNLCAAVYAIHERGYVIGDINESNILVTNQALVTLVDTDSFQVPGDGRTFRCPVGKPDYTPPELYGARYADIDRKAEHDAFGLGVLVFQLLMQGVHPYAGRFVGEGDPASIPKRIAAGHWPYTKGRRVPYEANPHAPAIEVLPGILPELVRRCFEEGHDRPTARPAASQWHEALRVAEKEMQPCSVNRQHIFNKALLFCPWCDLAARQGRDPFPSVKDVQTGNVGIPMALSVSDEKPARSEGILNVLPLREPEPYYPDPSQRSYEPNPILEVIFSPLWLVVLALLGLIILLVAILRPWSSSTTQPTKQSFHQHRIRTSPLASLQVHGVPSMARLLSGLTLALLTAPLPSALGQSALPLVEEVDPAPLRVHCRKLLQALDALKAPLPEETTRALQTLLREGGSDTALAAEVQKLLDPFCLVGVTINPESRVKAARGPLPAELRRGQERIVLIKIHNDAGVTHGLTIAGSQLRSGDKGEEGQWLEAVAHASPLLGKALTGNKLEYVVARLKPHETGKREATLKFDVGQGTQDLGFRAEVPVLFLVKE